MFMMKDFEFQLPGDKFGPGEHVIRYVATDLDDQSSKCEFTISVKRKQPTYSIEFNQINKKKIFHFAAYLRRIIHHHNDVIKAKPLENHESYIKCPGKPAVKIDTNFPVSRFRVFYRNFDRKSPPKSPNAASTNLPPKHFLTLFIDKVYDANDDDDDKP